MKMSRVHFIVAVLIGSFVVYCSQSSMIPGKDGSGRSDGSIGDGFVNDAHAQPSSQCCSPAPYTWTKIGEDTVAPGAQSKVFDVSKYREVVIYNSFGTEFPVHFLPTPSATVKTPTIKISAHPLRVSGPYLRWENHYTKPMVWTVYGIK